MSRFILSPIFIAFLVLEAGAPAVANPTAPAADASASAIIATEDIGPVAPKILDDTEDDGASVQDAVGNPDPAESTNRKIFAVNQYVDKHLLKPVAQAYENHVPDRVRQSVHNFTSNLGEPSVVVNDMLQGNVSLAWTSMRRFVVNTTVGGVGLFDPSTGWGLAHHKADFGQTLGVWGAGPGPDVQLPLIGFSNVRDTAGLIVGAIANPLVFIPGGAVSAIQTAATGIGAVDGRAAALPATDFLEQSAVDYYAAARSATAQMRAGLVEQGISGAPLP